MTDAAVGREEPGFSAAAFERRARARLDLVPHPDPLESDRARLAGDHRLSGYDPATIRRPRAATVLIGVIAREGSATLLMTLRAGHLRDHSGQIALPGGKIEAGDASPAAAALREAEEEVGLDPARVTPIGYLDPYLTGTGFLIVPTVAMVTPPFELTPDPAEVADVFEVPLAFLMDQANHARGSRALEGRVHSFYVMAYGERRIWGVTAGVIRTLYDRLYA